MNPYDLISYIYENYFLYILISILLSFLLYFLFKSQTLSFYDPIIFFICFTFGTSYAVVVLLFIGGIIATKYFILIVSSFIFLLLGSYLGFYSKKINFGLKRLDFNLNESSIKILLKFLILFYSLLLLYYIYNINFTLFFISRFEANKGLGHLVRIMEVIRCFVIASLTIFLFKGGNRVLKSITLLIFILVSSLVTGAKFAILESIYLAIITYMLFYGKFIKLEFKSILSGLTILLLVVFSSLFFTNRLAESMDYSSQYTKYNPAVEMLLSRVIANGDMYYLGLSNQVLDKVVDKDSSFIELIARPYLGGGVTDNIFNNNGRETITIGRAIWEYWYPNSLSGGSTDHFDLAAYSYFGYIGGSFFVFYLGFILGRINKMKINLYNTNKQNFTSIVFFALIYSKIYQLLLSPVVGVVALIDIFLIFLILIVFSKLFRHEA